jgi:hypothetical protein
MEVEMYPLLAWTSRSQTGDKEENMRSISLKTIRSICVLSMLTLIFETPGIMVTRDSALLLAQNRGQWNRGDRYYELGLEAGMQDARRNLSNNYRRYRREFNDRWEAEFRQGYEDGYESQFGRGYGNRGYGRSYGYRNDPYAHPSSGSMIWRGRVDHYVELRIRGDRFETRERQGAPTINQGANFTSPMPRSDVEVFVRKREGRGQVDLVQQPSRWNGYTAIVAINDESGGADDYEIELAWR